jgi:hypothetical protein
MDSVKVPDAELVPRESPLRREGNSTDGRKIAA